jgi:predicted nuclease with TOPRIM domain
VSSLQQQLRKATEVQAAKQHRVDREEENLAQENAKLKDGMTKVAEELWRMKEKNKELEEVRKGLGYWELEEVRKGLGYWELEEVRKGLGYWELEEVRKELGYFLKVGFSVCLFFPLLI